MSATVTTFPPLSDDQRKALEAFADANGEDWRDKLVRHWMNCTEPEGLKSSLRQVRNQYGPTWLLDTYAWGWTPLLPAWAPHASGDVARWSAGFDPPAIGDTVRVRTNSLGRATVTGYFVQGDWLGVIVRLDAPADWYVKQNGGNVPGHSFGAEIELEADDGEHDDGQPDEAQEWADFDPDC